MGFWDITEEGERMRVLVIAPHPDDEVIGCGGTILKSLERGDQVFLCVVTTACPPEWDEKTIAIKKKERVKATELLGVKKAFFLDLPTTKLDTIPKNELNKKISDCVKRVKPGAVFTSYWGDAHSDHRAVFDATVIATRPFNSPVKKVLCYEIPSTTYLTPDRKMIFSPNVFVDISKFLEKKLRVMQVYKTELRKYPHPRSIRAMRAHARWRGAQIGTKAAEAFVLVRDVR